MKVLFLILALIPTISHADFAQKAAKIPIEYADYTDEGENPDMPCEEGITEANQSNCDLSMATDESLNSLIHK